MKGLYFLPCENVNGQKNGWNEGREGGKGEEICERCRDSLFMSENFFCWRIRSLRTPPKHTGQ